MQNRRKFVLSLVVAVVGLGVVVVPTIADELFGVLTKVDVENKKLTVTEKGTDKEVEVTVTDETQYVSKKGKNKLDLARLSKQLTKAKDEGKKFGVAVTHEKGVASEVARKKAE
jgi:hypothetical protein